MWEARIVAGPHGLALSVGEFGFGIVVSHRFQVFTFQASEKQVVKIPEVHKSACPRRYYVLQFDPWYYNGGCPLVPITAVCLRRESDAMLR
jgi:hypothetical protein